MTGVRRDSNIELLRILASMAVIALHYNFHAGEGALDTLLAQGGHNLNVTILSCLEVLCNCAVNVFLLITGFYHSKDNKVRLFRPLSLIIQVILFQELITIMKLVMKRIQGGGRGNIISVDSTQLVCNAIFASSVSRTIYVQSYYRPE